MKDTIGHKGSNRLKKKKVKSADIGLDRRDVSVALEKNTLQITELDSTSMELLLSLLQGKHEYVTESVTIVLPGFCESMSEIKTYIPS